MKKSFFINKKYFIIVIIVVITSFLFYYISNDSNENQNPNNSVQNIDTELKVELGDIKNSIEVVGNAELVDEQSLNFNKAGTVTSVYFKEGDSVKKGETIAEIDSSDAYDTIEDAKISLENAKISLSDLYEEVDDSKILSAENSIKTAENNLENAKIELENLKISQENSLNKMLTDIETSKKELENLKKDKTDSINNTYTNEKSTLSSIENDFKSNFSTIEVNIEDMDYIFGVTQENKDKNDDFEDYLGAKDSTSKSKAKSNLLETISLKNELENSLNNYSYNLEKAEMINILNEFLNIYNSLYLASDYGYKAVEGSISSIGALTDSEIESMKNTMNSIRTNSLSKIDSIKKSIDNINTLTNTSILEESNEITIAKQEQSIENSLKDYDETKASYELTMQSKLQDIENKETSLELAKINLEELLEGPTENNIIKAQNSIKQAENKLESAYESLEDYILQAPFDGVIRKIDYMPGDKITNDNDKYVYIENPNLLEISVFLDQIDIINVEIGDKATITFDAYPTLNINAKISTIDTTPVQSSGVVSYEVKLVLDDENFDKKIYSGFTADVEIFTEYKENVLLVKSSSIIEEKGKNYLNIKRDNKEEKVEIETGISSGGMIEVISGNIQEGDIVITNGFAISNSGDSEGQTSLFGPTGGGSRGTRVPGGF